jgi:hypothetical protein
MPTELETKIAKWHGSMVPNIDNEVCKFGDRSLYERNSFVRGFTGKNKNYKICSLLSRFSSF